MGKDQSSEGYSLIGKVINYAINVSNSFMNEEIIPSASIDTQNEEIIPTASIDAKKENEIPTAPIDTRNIEVIPTALIDIENENITPEAPINIENIAAETKPRVPNIKPFLEDKNEILKNKITQLILSDSKETENDKKVLLQKIDELNTNISILAAIENFSTMVTKKYPNFSDQTEIFKMVLSKIKLHDKSLSKLEMESSLCLANATVRLPEKKGHSKLADYIEGLEYLDQANKIKIDKNFDTKFDIEEAVTQLIQSYPDKKEAFELAQKSLTNRSEHFTKDHPAILKGLINAAQVGRTNIDKNIRIEALKYATQAYNMAMRIEESIYTEQEPNRARQIEDLNSVKLTLKCLRSAEQALEYMSEIYTSFGNKKLASKLMNDSIYLSAKQSSKINEKVSNTQLIVKKGEVDANILAIRDKIQTSILDKVFQAAADGKWFNKTIMGEYGVSGYLDDYLKTMLGIDLCKSEDNIKTARMLCFEAINLGIMSTSHKDPTAAIIFAQEYPKLIEKILLDHPEYFVDEYILKLIIDDMIIFDLLETDFVHDTHVYATFEEEALTPIIEDRIQNSVLKPVAEIIKAQEWSPIIEKQLLEYASDDFLISYNYLNPKETCPLGNNLKEITDTTNIVRILIFKTIVETIEQTNSNNYSAVYSFMKKYHELGERILKDHPDYVKNSIIKQICIDLASHVEEVIGYDELNKTVIFTENAEEVRAIYDDIIQHNQNNELEPIGNMPMESIELVNS